MKKQAFVARSRSCRAPFSFGRSRRGIFIAATALAAVLVLRAPPAAAQQCGPGQYTFYVFGFPICIACNPGTYQPYSGQLSCYSCNPGTYQPFSGQASCYSCGVGRYQPNSGQSFCYSCGAGTYQPYSVNSFCYSCGAGTYQPYSGQSSCYSCGAGTYQPYSGQASCYSCGPGTHQPYSGGTSCSYCLPGQFNGQYGSATCWNCSPGTYQPNYGGAYCYLCPPGEVSYSYGYAQCFACPAGSFQPYAGESFCSPCPAGTTSEWGKTFCTSCPAGSFAVSGQSSCAACPAGTTSSPGSSSCTPCPAGTFTAASGTANCTACPAGTFSAASASACTTCPSGEAGNSSSGATGCTPVVCAPSDQCHVAGTYDPTSGLCSNPPAPDGTTCSDGNACTRTDTCQAGVCVGTNSVVCTAGDQCHVAGTCDSSTGVCSNPAAPDGTTCNDGDGCTQTDTCQVGDCIGTNPVVCTAEDACHAAGSCDPPSGLCSDPLVSPTLNPGVNQTIVGSCSDGTVAYTYPTVTNGCSATVTCTTILGNSYGDHSVTCIATNSAGSSPPISFTVTVLEPLTMQIQPPLAGDNGSVDNIAKAGSTVPVKVALFACGIDVTTTAAVTAKIGATYVPNGGAPGQNPVVTFNGVGDSGGVMVMDGQFFHYNLNTKDYAVTAGSNPAFYQLNLTVAYQFAPTVIVGTDTIQLDTK